MKIKCNDGIVRDFEVAHGDGDLLSSGIYQDGSSEAYCNECGEVFGCHDTCILKPVFKQHSCANLQINKTSRG